MIKRMSNADICTLDLYLFVETEKAILVGQDGTTNEKDRVWLPKSQVEFAKKSKSTSEYEVTLPEWLALQRGLI